MSQLLKHTVFYNPPVNKSGQIRQHDPSILYLCGQVMYLL